jgi:hypothetical protein
MHDEMPSIFYRDFACSMRIQADFIAPFLSAHVGGRGGDQQSSKVVIAFKIVHGRTQFDYVIARVYGCISDITCSHDFMVALLIQRRNTRSME